MSVDARRVQAAFLAAFDVSPPDRQAAVLDRECAGDAELRRRVEALLRAHADPASVLDRPAVAPLPNEFAGPPDPATETATVPGPSDGRRGGPLPLGFLGPPTRPDALGRLGHYEVLEVLGRGGFGIVLRAFDDVLQRVVAVKVLAPELAATSPARKRFLREARAYAAVRHENVVQVYEVVDQPLPYLVMEFIPGETLQHLLDRTGPLDAAEVLHLGRQIGEGLAAAHGTGLIHRDVKPANVLIEGGPRRRVKLTDFGLARAADDASISQSGQVAGTPMYMAPEQARGETLDPRADLFSFGSVLYVMCSGRPPFRANGTMAVLKRVCEDAPRPIREIIPEAPTWLCDLIARLHAKDPADRLPSAREVVDLLQRYQAELEAHGTVRPVPVRPARARWPRRVGLVAAAALIGVAAVVASRWPLHGPAEGPDDRPADTWRPKPPPTADELARLTSPFDALVRPKLPDPSAARRFGGAGRVPVELVALWDGAPGRLLRPGRTSWFAQDPDGKWLAVPCESAVVLFDARTMTAIKVLDGAPDRVYQVAFRPDGKRLAAGCWADGDSVVVWDVEAGGRPALRLKHRGQCRSVRFSPDGRRLLTVDADRTPILWDADSGEELRRFDTHEQAVWPDAVFTTDGKFIVTCVAAGVKVWDARTFAEVLTRGGPEAQADDLPADRHLPLAVSPDGKWVAAGSEAGFKVWSTADWKEQPGAATTATWLAFTPDGLSLLTAPHGLPEGERTTVCRWDVRTGRRVGGGPLASRGPWAVSYLSVDGKTLYGMTCDPAEPFVHTYDAETLAERVPTGHAGRVGAVAVSPDGARIVSAGADGSVRVWDVAAGRTVHTVGRAGKTAVRVIFSPDGNTAYAAWAEDGAIRAIDPSTGRWRDLAAYGRGVRHLAVSPDGALLAASGEGGARLWGLPDGVPRGEVPGAAPPTGAVAFSPDARTLAVGGPESIYLFDVATRRMSRALDSPGSVGWLGFRPGGSALAAAGDSVVIFDLANENPTTNLGGGPGPVLAAAWRADGGLLAAAGAAGGGVRLWDLAAGAPKSGVFPTSVPAEDGITAVTLAPDGRHLVTGHPDGSIAVFRLARRGEVVRLPRGD